MNLNELRYVLAVARENHFGRAAAQCHVSQPSLSVAIKKLEDELGVALFERSKSEVRLTAIGERVVAQAQKVLEGVKQLKDIAAGGKDQLQGLLRIGAIYTIGPYLFPQLLPALYKAAPEMPLYVQEDYTANLRRRLNHGELDIILISLPFHEQGIVTKSIYEEPFVVLLPGTHSLTAKTVIEADDLNDENVLLLGEGHCFRDQVVAACPNCLISRNGSISTQTIEGSSIETIRHMVASGVGVSILPLTATGVHYYSDDMLQYRELASPDSKRVIALAWRVSFPRPKVIDLIISTLRQCDFPGINYL